MEISPVGSALIHADRRTDEQAESRTNVHGETPLRVLSPRANYTDRAAAADRRS